LTLEKAKKALLLLLSSWEKGEIDSPWHVQEEAESIEQQLVDGKQLLSGRKVDGLATQINGVLDQLSNAQAQYVLPQDIDIMRELLESPELDIKKILTKYSRYWDSINYASREAKVQEYWFGKNT